VGGVTFGAWFGSGKAFAASFAFFAALLFFFAFSSESSESEFESFESESDSVSTFLLAFSFFSEVVFPVLDCPGTYACWVGAL
jgi:hypothetical protein